MFKQIELTETSGKVLLSGQIRKGADSCILPTTLGIYEFLIEVIEGEIQLNHNQYNVDGGTWLNSLGRCNDNYKRICKGQKIVAMHSIEEIMGKPDIIEIVNISFFKEAIFNYSIIKK